MFDNLSDRMDRVFKTLRGEAALNEWHIENALKEIRVALLEADVHFKVVKDFTNRVREKAVGADVLTAFSPAQQVTKVVRDELQTLLGGNEVGLALIGSPAVVMMTGLQGSGKTTTSGKLSLHLKNRGKRPLLVPCDVYRPAAIEQLRIVANNVKVPFFELRDERSPLAIASKAVQDAKTLLHDVVILDTAGRLHVDDELMQELEAIKRETRPSEILFVADAMTGQDAVKSAKEFDDRLGVTGVVLTKLDGDARGGAALSIKSVGHRQIINGSRKKRIAKGSGTSVQEINRLLKQYLAMKKMMKTFSKGFGARRFGKMVKGLPPEFLQ